MRTGSAKSNGEEFVFCVEKQKSSALRAVQSLVTCGGEEVDIVVWDVDSHVTERLRAVDKERYAVLFSDFTYLEDVGRRARDVGNMICADESRVFRDGFGDCARGNSPVFVRHNFNEIYAQHFFEIIERASDGIMLVGRENYVYGLIFEV